MFSEMYFYWIYNSLEYRCMVINGYMLVSVISNFPMKVY